MELTVTGDGTTQETDRITVRPEAGSRIRGAIKEVIGKAVGKPERGAAGQQQAQGLRRQPEQPFPPVGPEAEEAHPRGRA